ncbi:uncharacterized protein LOC113306122 [Papaver somniferum]|uniref:uncharacterized protein LOC113306122 n=1 Tax=Papaver somniferum TaxID=3469 RepID=UPI000E6F6D76|nr:uncharacterized protein LOC113306122 [Papaver somniferum]
MVTRGGSKPSYLLVADDIFIFCNGNKNSLENLMKLLMHYQESSGQIVNRRKSKCFVGGVSELRRRKIVGRMQMDLSEFLDKYLGIILNPGRVKTSQVWGMVELLQQLLKLLSKSVKKIIRNFLWSSDPAVKKLITVKWDEVCAPFEEGGLGFRRLEVINKALLMELLWKIENEHEEWTDFMRDKYKHKNGEWITSYRQSSTWPGLKWVMHHINEGSRWLVGDGRDISVWRDKWVKNLHS